MSTPAHDQVHSSRYEVHYPEHGTREGDPNYRDFDAFHRRTKKDPDLYQCAVGKRRGDFADCTLNLPLELHHTHIEWALQNGVDLSLLERQYPGVSNVEEVGAWVESAENLEWLCQLVNSIIEDMAAPTSPVPQILKVNISYGG